MLVKVVPFKNNFEGDFFFGNVKTQNAVYKNNFSRA